MPAFLHFCINKILSFFAIIHTRRTLIWHKISIQANKHVYSQFDHFGCLLCSAFLEGTEYSVYSTQVNIYY